MQAVWADTVLSAERQHLLRLLAWSALSILLGTSLFLVLAVRRVRSSLLTHFATQTSAWGVAIGLATAAAWFTLQLPDVGDARRLERLTWMSVGLSIGVIAVGATLALSGRAPRRLGMVGAGLGVLVQGISLLLLHLQFAGMVSR